MDASSPPPSKKMNRLMSNIKSGFKNMVHKIKGTDPKNERSPEQLLKELEPHFIKTLTQSGTESDKMFFTELHKRLLDVADKGNRHKRDRLNYYVNFRRCSNSSRRISTSKSFCTKRKTWSTKSLTRSFIF